MAQRFVRHVAQVLAPDCAPLFLTYGWRESMAALLTHYYIYFRLDFLPMVRLYYAHGASLLYGF